LRGGIALDDENGIVTRVKYENRMATYETAIAAIAAAGSPRGAGCRWNTREEDFNRLHTAACDCHASPLQR